MENEYDLLDDHFRILEGVSSPTLDTGFYGRLRHRMAAEAKKQERKMLRGAAWTAGVLLIMLMLNLRWLRPAASEQTLSSSDGIAGFAEFYDQSIPTDL